jgi:hypothetical protein
MKICTQCKKEKELEFFRKEAKGKFGVSSKCKDCLLEKDREYRENNKEKIKQNHKKWDERHPRGRYWNNVRFVSTWHGKIAYWKKNAGVRKITWDLSPEYIKSLPLVCAYTGIKLTLDINKKNTVSLDRIDSDKGYIAGNVVFCATRINLMKMKMNKQEFIEWCKLVSAFN